MGWGAILGKNQTRTDVSKSVGEAGSGLVGTGQQDPEVYGEATAALLIPHPRSLISKGKQLVLPGNRQEETAGVTAVSGRGENGRCDSADF